MKLIKTSLLVFTVLLGTLVVKAQTADDIVAKHIAAIGGKEKINGIKSLQMESTMSVMGNEAPMTTTILNGKGFKNVVEFNGQKIIQAYTDKGGWMVNPMMGSTDPQAMPEEQYKASKSEIYVGGPLLDYAAKGNKVELAGKEKVGTVDAYKLKVTTSDKTTSTFYIDPATYYLIRTVRTVSMNGQDNDIAVTYSDFKKTDYGYVMPYSFETTLPQGLTMSAIVKKVEVNKEVDPKIFDMPKQ